MARFVDSSHKESAEALNKFLKSRKIGRNDFQWSDQQILDHNEKFAKPWMGMMVGDLLVALVLYVDLKNVLEISYLETHSSYWRRGFMKQLLEFLFTSKKECGIWLDVHEKNHPAQRLYEGLGFKKSGLRKGYYRDGGDCFQLSRAESSINRG